MVVPVAYGLQLQLPKMSGGGPRPWEETREAYLVPLCLSFVKWEKGIYKRGGGKGALTEGFFGQVDFREKVCMEVKSQKLIILKLFVPSSPLERFCFLRSYQNSSKDHCCMKPSACH